MRTRKPVLLFKFTKARLIQLHHINTYGKRTLKQNGVFLMAILQVINCRIYRTKNVDPNVINIDLGTSIVEIYTVLWQSISKWHALTLTHTLKEMHTCGRGIEYVCVCDHNP